MSNRTEDSTPSLKPLSGLQKALTIFLGLNLVARLLMTVQHGVLLEFIHQVQTGNIWITMDPETYGTLIDQAAVTLSAMNVLTFLGCVIVFCIWTYRAMKNLHEMGSPEVDMSPGWAVGSYFVPIISYLVPFIGFQEIWRGTHKATGDGIGPNAAVGLWWATWVIGLIASSISSAVMPNDPLVPLFSSALIGAIASNLLLCLSTVLLIQITRVVTRKQDMVDRGDLAQTFA